jgi:L,D-peptidoglycan transpeptidase YkuD (ErfK/YbiS/YcfS/YnhG family)
MLVSLLCCGCSHLSAGLQAKEAYGTAHAQFTRGDYPAALGTYQQILARYPATGDRALFEMGIIHAYPENGQKEYAQALECFRRLLREFPGSGYQKDSEIMIFNITNAMLKDQTIAAQQVHLTALQQQVASSGVEIAALRKTIATLEQELKSKELAITKLQQEPVVLVTGPADKILIEKKERRLTLFAKGKVLKTYPIALGGNPIGPKERQGDNKTPEGTYVIDARNKNSRYHLSLHISYPNEKDRKRARELGVSPGGDIMIHGIKNGLSWAGEKHAEVDWTQGCIAVTDAEIEEIERVVPNGTTVEIRP